MSFKKLDRYNKVQENKERKPRKPSQYKQISVNKEVVNQPTKRFVLKNVTLEAWRFEMAARIGKDRGIDENIIMEQYFRYNAIPVYVLSALSGSSERKILEDATAKYFGSTLLKEPTLTSVIMFRLFKGSEPLDKGVESILIDNKFILWMNAIHKKKKLL
jgi:hypothetical protein